MNLKPVFFVSGFLLLVLSAAMFLPMIIDLVGDSPDWQVFAGAQITATFIGLLLIFTNKEEKFKTSVRETFLMTAIGWILLAVFGALPFCLSFLHMTPAQGFFEAMSGLTTTGLTTIGNLDGQPHGILLWRALLQWLGGIGGLISALVILPLLQVSGQQVFRAQSFDIAKILPSASQMAVYISIIYTGLTLICALLLSHAGMSTFEAFCHAMSAISTGGFSTSDASIGHFNNSLTETILIYFMLLGSLPFTLYLRMARGDALAVFKDGQVKAFFSTAVLLSAVMTIYLLFSSNLNFLDAMRHATFKIFSLVTTTGLTLQDDTLWGPFAVAIFFAAAFIGGCSGSAAGGIRFFRMQILWSMLKLQIRKLIEPNGVFQAYYNKKPVDTDIQNAIGVFLLVYIFIFLLTGAALTFTGINFAAAFTSALAAITNTGPALRTVGSPLADFGTLSSTPLWILSTCMLLGRMEIFTILVLFSSRFWRR